jgi:hypothetical protein
MTLPLFKEAAGAQFSEGRAYRYRLWRSWGPGPRACFCMLNPSTADEDADDPTLRRCIGFAKQWGLGGVECVNLFALVSADPKRLQTHPDPVGPDNNKVLIETFSRCDRVVLGWGACPSARRRARDVFVLVAASGALAQCLGTTTKGDPRHPLYLPKQTPLVRWFPSEASS